MTDSTREAEMSSIGGSDSVLVVVEDLLRTLNSAVRSQRLYEGGGGTDRFLGPLRDRFTRLWTMVDVLTLEVAEYGLRWDSNIVYENSRESLDFGRLVFRDGLRELTFLPGFEADELPRFLTAVVRAPNLDPEEDDLVSLLWQEDFSLFRYRSVEAFDDVGELVGGSGSTLHALDPAAVRGTADASSPGLTPEDFEETLYFLSDADLRRLWDEVRKENERDLWHDLLNALYDRLEDSEVDRQTRILKILADLLPSLLSEGEIDRAALMLQELVSMANRKIFSPPVLLELRSLFNELSSPRTLEQLIFALDEAPEQIGGDSVAALLSYFPPGAMAPLLRGIEMVQRPDTRRALDQVVQRLASQNPASVVELLQSDDADVVRGATRWVSRVNITSAAPDLIQLLEHHDASVRLAAIESLQHLRVAAAGSPLIDKLTDLDRDVRVAAARALGAMAYGPARPALREAVASRRIRAADRSEKVAFFEALGRLAASDDLTYLEKVLNSRGGLIGRGEPSEIRACAALALAQSQHPAARTALSRAAADDDAVVRNAVTRALRREAP